MEKIKIYFYKYQGTGNDFILIDNRKSANIFPQKLITDMCNRKFGIGSDGLILLEDTVNYDFSMKYFNPDGSEGVMCGNGGRCIVAFARDLGIITESCRFIAPDGLHCAAIDKNVVKLNMTSVERIEIADNYYFLDTGAPHYVIAVPDAFDIDVDTEGPKWRHLKTFSPSGANVDFISLSENEIKISTFEKGVETETLACGTGCVAGALTASLLRKDTEGCYLIRATGGNLSVSFRKTEDGGFEDIVLCGPAEYVFSGTYCISRL